MKSSSKISQRVYSKTSENQLWNQHCLSIIKEATWGSRDDSLEVICLEITDCLYVLEAEKHVQKFAQEDVKHWN